MTQKLDLLYQLVKTSFKMRYQNSVLGFLWVLIKPYAMFLVMYFIISGIRGDGSELKNFGLYLLTGLIFYTYIQEMVLYGQMALLERANVILKVNFDRQIAVLSAVINGLISFVVNLILIFILITIYNTGLSPLESHLRIEPLFTDYIYMIYISLITFTLIFGVSMITSIYSVWFRDLRNIFELFFAIFYWATPIFYTIEDSIGGKTISSLIKYNPIGIIINEFRSSLDVYGEPNYLNGFIVFVVTVIFILVGWKFFSIKVKKIAEFF